ncbi:6048_t:CDS:2 [Funneliformis caledonium]|uniref:6048_t:CDS:1 n=1 Tax=Funneliformis caledonium TaxID=1117310 RepID=A0A9N9FPR5_9GLOM|nr:6048_t:CDS:2 [Funneliformis caledonium]
MLKAIRLALFNLQKSLSKNSPGLEDLETFGILVNKIKFQILSQIDNRKENAEITSIRDENNS